MKESSKTRQRMPSRIDSLVMALATDWLTDWLLWSKGVTCVRWLSRSVLLLAEERRGADEECSWLQVLVVPYLFDLNHLHQSEQWKCFPLRALFIFLIDWIFLCKEISNHGQQKGSGGETKIDESSIIQKKRHLDDASPPVLLFQRWDVEKACGVYLTHKEVLFSWLSTLPVALQSP